jgi:hypothetical protein
VRYLAEELGLGRDGAVKVITKCPQVLAMSIEDNIAPKVRYLAEEVGLGNDGTAKVIARFPIVLGLSVEDKYRAQGELPRGGGGSGKGRGGEGHHQVSIGAELQRGA